MWMFEQRGFISVVAYDPTKDRNSKSQFQKIVLGDKGLKAFKKFKKDRTEAEQAIVDRGAETHLLVRARIKEDLNWLKGVQPNLVIETDAGADYAYRAVLTRSKFKKALANSVDLIDYDSHFKEQARDNSPAAEGRYSAMMSCWSAMANLQPISPWSGSHWSSGYGTGYSGYSTGGGSSKSSTTVGTSSTTTSATTKPRVVLGARDMDEFWDEYVASEGNISFRNGNGPRTGFQENDRVRGYFGTGTVVKVESRKNGADMVTVQPDNEKATKNFVSNYLEPETDPEWVADAIVNGGLPEAKYDLESVYEWVRDNLDSLESVPDDYLTGSDNNGFELITRLQERVNGTDASPTVGLLNEVHDEILWETSDDAFRLTLALDDAVPPRYEADAANMLAKAAIAADNAAQDKETQDNFN